MSEVNKGFNVGLTDDDNEAVYEIPLGFDENGEVTESISVVGKNSQKYKDADRQLSRATLKKSSVRGRGLDLKRESDADEFLDAREASNVTLATAATVGWKGLTSGGEVYEFSQANAKALYAGNTYIRDKVMAAVEDAANFLKR